MRNRVLLVLALSWLSCAIAPAIAAANATAPLTFTPAPVTSATVEGFAGSTSCRKCHEGFYQKWSTSWHGLAMQPYSDKFSTEKLTAQTTSIVIGKANYLAEVGTGQGWVIEKTSESEQEYPIAYVMGGKNVYYFLTPLDKGRLQTLPLAYDVHKKEWYDTAASALRHFPGELADSPLHWKERPYTFNTACYNCHVSQLSTNYNAQNDTYNTTWLEPGINCETCHGPGVEHNRVFEAAAAAGETTPSKLHLISTRKLSAEQNNAICMACHAKMSALSPSFPPGERFFDHFDLVTLEEDDYYPDGRDLGENYTATSWLMSPCAKASPGFTCIHCHTSSGRYRFSGTDANNACLPCHKQRVETAPTHSHHAPGTKGNQCVSCHMPMTTFARMNRSDHSMRPPMPALTEKLGSPNACNLCHKERNAEWANKKIAKWHTRDYQAETIRFASLIDDARKRNWTRLPEMVAYIGSAKRDDIVANSLIRLMRSCENEKCASTFVAALSDTSPLLRASAADALAAWPRPDTLAALAMATRDPVRLVRLRAAGALASADLGALSDADRKGVETAFAELQTALQSHPDDSGALYNLGNFLSGRRKFNEAISYYEAATRLRPDSILALVNSSLAYNAMGDNAGAEKALRRAIEINPRSSAAHLNLALLLGETGRVQEAETEFRRVLELEPTAAVAAYNLAVIAATAGDLARAIELCRTANNARPQDPKYAYTLAFYLKESRQTDEALDVARQLVQRHPGYADGAMFLSAIYEERGETEQARSVLTTALTTPGISPADRQRLETRLAAFR